tara:strand:- start:7743 stop:8207 length:465 start_codon:yes stop_codon:yes gene_type:complete
MATGLLNGTDLLIKMGGTDGTDYVVAFATSCSLEISMDEIDQTSKDSAGWKQVIGGTRSWSLSSEALYQNEEITTGDNRVTFQSFWNYLGDPTDGRKKVYVEFTIAGSTSAANNVYYSGNAIVTSLSVNGGTEDQSTYSVTLTGSGQLLQEDTP